MLSSSIISVSFLSKRNSLIKETCAMNIDFFRQEKGVYVKQIILTRIAFFVLAL